MKITKIEEIPVSVPFRENIREELFQCKSPAVKAKVTVYKVYTDDGLMGIAESRLPLKTPIDSYIGKSPFDLLNDDNSGYLLMAFYDLAGKYLNIPAYKLMGQLCREKVEVPFWSHCFSPELLARETEYALEQGFKVHKIKARPFRDPIEQMEAVSRVAPDDYRIIIDPNESWKTVAKSVDICNEYKKRFKNIWAIEEPFSRWNVDAYDQLRGRIDYHLAIHAWENIFQTRLQSLHCDKFVIETDRFGPTLWNTAAIAESCGMSMWLEYGLRSGISAAFQSQQAAVMPSCEFCITLIYVLEDDLVLEPMDIKDGYYTIPQKPGLGVTIDEDALEKYRIDK